VSVQPVRTSIDILRLRVLAAIAAQGSVTKAAKHLNYSQPAVSHHLARLEAETLAGNRDSAWIAGCENCRREFLEACDQAGFVPPIAYTSDDIIVQQALVAAGMGVTTMPGLALRTHHAPKSRPASFATSGGTSTWPPMATRRIRPRPRPSSAHCATPSSRPDQASRPHPTHVGSRTRRAPRRRQKIHRIHKAIPDVR
jgi:DNA-binding transcriptional LysR family regulator